jgi:predicted DsbA family dithiol-disulfide isomerase
MAMENEHIRGDMVEAQEYPHLSQRYGVFSVPKVVLNESTSFEGALPEQIFLQFVLKAAGKLSEDESKQLGRFAR